MDYEKTIKELNNGVRERFNMAHNPVNRGSTTGGRSTVSDRLDRINDTERTEATTGEKRELGFTGALGIGFALLVADKVLVPTVREVGPKVKENLLKCIKVVVALGTAVQPRPQPSTPVPQATPRVPIINVTATTVSAPQPPTPAVPAVSPVPQIAVPVIPVQPPQVQPTSSNQPQPPYDSRWLEVIRHPCRVTTLGGPGSGKTYLIHALAELLHFKMNVCLVGFPGDKFDLLPGWLSVEDDLSKVGPNTAAFLDEAYLTYPARDSQRKASRDLSEPLGLFRQKRQSLFFVVQETRMVDKNVISSSDVLIVKDPGTMQLEFERPEIRKILARAKEALDKIPGDKKNWAYVHCPWFQGLLEIPKAQHWSENLSRVYAFGSSSFGSKQPKVITLEEKRQEAKRLYATRRYSYQRLAELFGRDKSTIIYWVKHCE